ncbi:MAG: dienelactone hydrolase family protein [Novosphingobium sp.]|nr:dienelactone hydrolase family protein [Novosphingobium sp.]MCP5401264.1 dienelactone hydrolase family protein [Novosphingobium sp.]
MEGLAPVRCDHDGFALQGYYAAPEGEGPFPAVMVMHSGLGLRKQIADKVRMLAARGYLAVATDMYGADADISTPDAAGERYAELTQDMAKLRERTVAWFDTVAARPDVDEQRIGAIGYCFGGMCVLELARSGADVKAVSSFHGVLTTRSPARPGTVRARIAAYCGTEDPFAPLADVDALRSELSAAGARYQIMEFAGVAHGFSDPSMDDFGREGIRYDAVADRVSLAGTLALLDAVLRS